LSLITTVIDREKTKRCEFEIFWKNLRIPSESPEGTFSRKRVGRWVLGA